MSTVELGAVDAIELVRSTNATRLAAVGGRVSEIRVTVKELATLAARSCIPGLLGAAVCLLALLVMPLLGFTAFFSPALPSDSTHALFSATAAVDRGGAVVASGVRGRFALGLSTITLLLTAGVVLLATRAVIATVLDGTRRHLRTPVIALAFVGAALAFICSFVPQLLASGPDLWTFLLERAGIPPGGRMEVLMAVANAVTTAVTVLLAIAFSIVTAPPTKGPRQAAELANRLWLLKMLLYLAAACLVSRVVQVYSLHAWPGSQLDNAAAVESIAVSIGAANGVIYSLFLASVYLPAAMTLADRARSLRMGDDGAAPADPPAVTTSEATPQNRRPSSLDDLLALQRTSSGPIEDFGRVLAILSPVLVGLLQGPVLDMVKRLAGSGER